MKSDAIKGQYVVRQKTENVDVDSHGRSCKEKMMKVLCEVRCSKRSVCVGE